jgi:hydroxymethylglutaryl-CoA reductase (NADPH)
MVDGKEYMVPLATTEGALVASTNRGARAIAKSGGVRTALTGDGMTRAPLLRMPSLEAARDLREWLDTAEAKAEVADAFASTSRFGRLQTLSTTVVGRNVYLRFKCNTGDAMGMNMITKGVNAALATVIERFPTARVLSLSGNLCTDKKPSAVNWVDGRGKSVVAEVVLPREVVEGTLKTTADALVELNIGKNLVGSAAAGSLGGFNAHASNIVSAVFLATGQDVAQNVESSACITLLEHDDDEANPGGVIASVTMPCIEVGTVGGGTGLASQAACLDLLGLRGASSEEPGANASTLAKVVAASVLAGELSLMAAHTTGDLLRAHMALNRATAPAPAAAAGAAASPGATGGAPTHTATAARMAQPSHSMASTAGGAGPFKAPELRAFPVGRRYFAAAMHRAPAEPVCAAKPAPSSLSRAKALSTSEEACPVMRGV